MRSLRIEFSGAVEVSDTEADALLVDCDGHELWLPPAGVKLALGAEFRGRTLSWILNRACRFAAILQPKIVRWSLDGVATEVWFENGEVMLMTADGAVSVFE